MKTKFLKHQTFRIAVMTIVALAFSLMLFTVLITLGFSRYSSIKPKDYEVNFLGMPIYTISDETATAHNGTMMFLGFIFTIVFILVGETIATRAKKEETKKLSHD